MHKYIDGLTKHKKYIDWNTMDKENENVREKMDGGLSINIAVQIGIQEEDEKNENEYIMIYEEHKNNNLHLSSRR